MSELSIGVGVIGAGAWGRKLVQEYWLAKAKGIELRKVCDESLPALGAIMINRGTEKLNSSLLTQNLNEVLADEDIAAVHIATPSPTHYEIGRKALEAGKHVLVEKPMAMSATECYELVDLAKSQELVLHVGHIYRFNNAIRKVRSLLDDPVMDRFLVGKIYYFRVQWTDTGYFRDRDIIFDLGPHPIDILNQLLHAWPTHVSAIARAYRNGGEHNEVAYVGAEFLDNVFAHIEMSWLHPSKVREVVIVGSSGTLTVDCLNQRITHRNGDAATEIPVHANNTIASEIEYFCGAVARNDFSSESGLLGAHTVQALEEINACLFKPSPEAGTSLNEIPARISSRIVNAKPAEAEIEMEP